MLIVVDFRTRTVIATSYYWRDAEILRREALQSFTTRTRD